MNQQEVTQPIETNDVLLAVSLLERVEGLLLANTRESISKNVCNSILRNYSFVLDKLFPYYKGVDVLMPIVESTELLKFLCESADFVETDNDTKLNLINMYNEAMQSVYLFAGKFYTTNHFKFSLGNAVVLKRIVDACIDNGYYFGIDEELGLAQ